MPLTTADIGTQLLMDNTVSLQEIAASLTARFFSAVLNLERGPAVRRQLPQQSPCLPCPEGPSDSDQPSCPVRLGEAAGSAWKGAGRWMAIVAMTSQAITGDVPA